MSQLKRGAMLSYVNIILNNVVGIIITPFIIRALGNSEYGLYSLVGALVAYIGLMDFGVGATVVRYVAMYRAKKDKHSETEFLATTCLIYAFIIIILIFVSVILYINLPRIFSKALTTGELIKIKIMFVVFIFNLCISIPGGVYTSICNAYEYFVFPRLLNNIKYIIRSLAVFIVLYMGGKAVSLVIIDSVINIIAIAVTFFYVKKNVGIKINFAKYNVGLIKGIFSYSIWVFLMGVVFQFIWSGGQLLLGVKTNTATVAVYAIGIALGAYYGAFSNAISSVFLPRAATMVLNNTPAELTEFMIKVGRITLMILSLILLNFFIFGKEFITLWVGVSYTNAWLIALLIMVTHTIPLIQSFGVSILEAQSKVKFRVIIFLICFSFGILLGSNLISSYGSLGMIIGICSSWMIAQLILNIFYIKILKLNMAKFFKTAFFPVFLPCLVPAILIYYLNIYIGAGGWYILVFKMLFSVAVFTLMMFYTIMNSNEKNMLLSIKK